NRAGGPDVHSASSRPRPPAHQGQGRPVVGPELAGQLSALRPVNLIVPVHLQEPRMNGGIFLIQSGGGLVEMKEQPYDTEPVLLELLAKYPNLLAGDQMDGAAPRRWLLVSREMGVPSEEEGGDRWSLDHLFLDQDAIPTLIEVKRSSDTRIRREVVG